MIATSNPLTAARATALFVSDLSATEQPTGVLVEAAIKHALQTHGGTRGCAADVAAAYGECPELAARLRTFSRAQAVHVDPHANAGQIELLITRSLNGSQYSAAPGLGEVVGRAEAPVDVVVDGADVLHECVHAGGSDEAVPLRFQLFGEGRRLRRRGG
jgi:hypothetical protein